MKKLAILLASLLPATTLVACGDDSTDNPGVDARTDAPSNPDSPGGGETIRVSEDISQNTTWTKDNVYVLPRLKYVFVQSGATLTIEPGTVIKGEQGSVLVVARGGKIRAEGTAAEPITFTSSQPTGQRSAGWWGGLLILGNAPVNVNKATGSDEATYEAFTSAIPEGKFGGTDPADNSGSLKYVRIQFAGFNFVSDREFNNLTLAGVGSGTVIDYVQVHGGSDDGIEMFGGTVNVKHLVSSQNQDDGFDTDNGWQGNAQFVVIQNVSHPETLAEASNGYESDNHGTAASYAQDPRTLPTLYNVTLIGDHTYTGTSHYAAVFRRGTGGNYYNHVWYGFNKGIEFRDATTGDQITAGNLKILSSTLFGTGADGQSNSVATTITDFQLSAHTDKINLTNVDPGLTANAINKTAPNFKPTAPLTTGAATPPGGGFFDTSATFIGAIGADDWTTGWTEYPQN
ncbi:MAG: hypothetical protein SFX73_13060 [Kofleriaceae bacterium]|nr:hypothetical protein [Kofleriaceae bacterium]